MSDRDYITVLTIEGSDRANKLVFVKDGEVHKDGTVDSGCYLAVTVPCKTDAEVAGWLLHCADDPRLTICLGFIPDMAERPGEVFNIWSKRRVVRARGMDPRVMTPQELERQSTGRHEFGGVPTWTRTKGNFKQSSVQCLDRDLVPGMPTELADMSFADWLGCLPLLFPGIERCGMVHVPSTSGRVLVDGTPWSPKPSWHLYFRVDDPDDFRDRVWKPAVVQSFDALAPMAGVPLGFMRLSKSHKDPTGQTVTAHTPWTIYDPTTCSPERLFYDGQPLLRNDPSGAGPVLTLAPPQVRVLQEGGKLNVAMIPDLAPAQQRAAAKRGVRVERDKKAPGGRLIYTTLVSSTLKLDLPLDLDPYGGGVFTTVRELWLDCAGHTRCQSPYRESTSQAAFLSFHDVTGAPYLVDQGSNTRYELDATDCAGPSPDDFFKALEAWVAANGAGGKIEDTALIKQAADRIKNVVCAAARHGWEQSAVDVLLERLADFMAKPYGMAKSKLSAMFRRDTKKAAKEAAKFASAVDEIDAEDEQHEWLEQMNAEYAVVMLGGSTRVAKVDEWDPCLGRRYIRVMGLADFQAAFMNVLVHAPTLKEPDRMMPLGAWWLRQGGRRQHLGGITLDPTNQLGPEYLNTWKGFSVAPVAGDPSIFLRHLDHLTAGNGPEARAYLERWLAYKVQNPAEQLEVAIVMRGSEGVGKGSLGQTMRRLFGSHGLHISQAEHLVGKFNAHLMDTCLLFADEAFFAGDPKHVSVLKALITESVITIEKKFVDAHQGRNHLGIIMASNSDFVVPAGKDSRRFFCVDVPDTLMGDRDYFNAYWRAVEDQEQLGAFLYYLQNLDLRGFNVRDFPMTEMLAEQKLATLAHEEKWLFEILSRGYVDDPATIGGMTINGYSSIGHVWRNEAATVFLHNNYLVHMRAIAHGRFALDSGRFGRFMNRYFKAIRGQRPARLPSYALGNLEEARTAFAEYHGLNGFDWGEGDEDERPEAAAVTSAARPEAADDWTTCAGCNTMFHAPHGEDDAAGPMPHVLVVGRSGAVVNASVDESISRTGQGGQGSEILPWYKKARLPAVWRGGQGGQGGSQNRWPGGKIFAIWRLGA